MCGEDKLLAEIVKFMDSLRIHRGVYRGPGGVEVKTDTLFFTDSSLKGGPDEYADYRISIGRSRFYLLKRIHFILINKALEGSRLVEDKAAAFRERLVKGGFRTWTQCTAAASEAMVRGADAGGSGVTEAMEAEAGGEGEEVSPRIDPETGEGVVPQGWTRAKDKDGKWLLIKWPHSKGTDFGAKTLFPDVG